MPSSSPSARSASTHASLTKHHDELSGQATVSEQELAAALPSQLRLRPVEDPSGELVLEGAVGPITARARLTARDGALIVAPEGLLGGLGSLTVFKDSRVKVTDVGATHRPAGHHRHRLGHARGLAGEATFPAGSGSDYAPKMPRADHSVRSEPRGRSRPVAIARRGSSRPPTTSTKSS